MKKIIREALNTTLIVLGILSAGLGLKGFLLSSQPSLVWRSVSPSSNILM